jgi:uncharacterized damage-inducible protein DinB
MSFAQRFLPELDQEMTTTRRALERVPEDRLEWRPHPKSATLGRLATHIGELSGFGVRIFAGDSFDILRGGGGYQPLSLGSVREILELFDGNVQKSREQIEQASEEALRESWTLRRGDSVIFSLPRAAVLRTMLLSHLIHHRGQLSVYLRLNEVPVPSIYGPTADEP